MPPKRSYRDQPRSKPFKPIQALRKLFERPSTRKELHPRLYCIKSSCEPVDVAKYIRALEEIKRCKSYCANDMDDEVYDWMMSYGMNNSRGHSFLIKSNPKLAEVLIDFVFKNVNLEGPMIRVKHREGFLCTLENDINYPLALREIKRCGTYISPDMNYDLHNWVVKNHLFGPYMHSQLLAGEHQLVRELLRAVCVHTEFGNRLATEPKKPCYHKPKLQMKAQTTAATGREICFTSPFEVFSKRDADLRMLNDALPAEFSATGDIAKWRTWLKERRRLIRKEKEEQATKLSAEAAEVEEKAAQVGQQTAQEIQIQAPSSFEQARTEAQTVDKKAHSIPPTAPVDIFDKQGQAEVSPVSSLTLPTKLEMPTSSSDTDPPTESTNLESEQASPKPAPKAVPPKRVRNAGLEVIDMFRALETVREAQEDFENLLKLVVVKIEEYRQLEVKVVDKLLEIES